MTDRTQIRVVTTGLALFLVAAWVTYFVGFFTGDGFGVALPLYVKVFYGILLALISIVFLDAMVPRKRERVGSTVSKAHDSLPREVLEPGRRVRLGGFSKAENNGTYKVLSFKDGNAEVQRERER